MSGPGPDNAHVGAHLFLLRAVSTIMTSYPVQLEIKHLECLRTDNEALVCVTGQLLTRHECVREERLPQTRVCVSAMSMQILK